jgi:hypothetical protein
MKDKDCAEKDFYAANTEAPQKNINIIAEDAVQTDYSEGKETDIKAVAANVQEILAQVQDFAYKEKINRELHEELQSYKSGFRRDILSSVLKNIIHWHSKISDQYTFYTKKQEEENTDLAALFPVLLKEYKNLADGLEDLLYDNDIETVIPAVGDEFNPRTQKSVRTIPPTDAGMERKIAECINVGFRDTTTERILKQPEVVVYQIKTE